MEINHPFSLKCFPHRLRLWNDKSQVPFSDTSEDHEYYRTRAENPSTVSGKWCHKYWIKYHKCCLKWIKPGMLKWIKRTADGEYEDQVNLVHFTHLPGADPSSRCYRKMDSNLSWPKLSHNEQTYLSIQLGAHSFINKLNTPTLSWFWLAGAKWKHFLL